MSREPHEPSLIFSNDPLPEFARPPVAEVALSVTFEALELLHVPQIGLLWHNKFSDRFPIVEEQAPLEPMNEHLEEASQSGFSITFDTGTPLPRLWFLNTAGTELIQLQRNWFARNWRKLTTGAEYPRYPRLIETFLDDYTEFCGFVREHKVGEPTPTQCEITYVNQIAVSDEWSQPGDLDRVLNLCAFPGHGEFPGRPDHARTAVSWLMAESDRVFGRLHCTAVPATSIEDGGPVIVLTLTARGVPFDTDSQGLQAFYDRGREYIVRTFEAVTTESMHRVWGKIG